MKLIYSLTLFGLTLLNSVAVNASLILEQYSSNTPTPDMIGGYQMTDFDVVNSGQLGTTTSTVVAPSGDVLTFTDSNGAVLDLTRGLADSTDWWINGEGSDYDIYTTDVHWVTILLPVNTYAVSFNVGANVNAYGWLQATETDGFGIDTNYSFNLGPTNSPGFGLYTDHSAGAECSSISSVTIEPLEWGVGNFSIFQGDSSCGTSVSEPSTGLLAGFGVLVFLVTAIRRRQRQ